jgi:hypothetical protein
MANINTKGVTTMVKSFSKVALAAACMLCTGSVGAMGSEGVSSVGGRNSAVPKEEGRGERIIGFLQKQADRNEITGIVFNAAMQSPRS